MNGAVQVLDDDRVDRLITPTLAVHSAREALLAAYGQTLVTPDRQKLPAGVTDLVFSVGGLLDGPTGFRVYGLWPGDSDQLVAVWRPEGRLRGLVLGTRLGAYRTGALGAVALDLLAPTRVDVLAVVGTGRQAWTQLWASTAVRSPGLVRVTSRDPQRRESFATRARQELGIEVEATASAEVAVHDATAVITATTSTSRVLELDWLTPGCHVNTVGPKFTGRSELPPELVRAAALVVSDSPAQLTAVNDPMWDGVSVRHLGALLADRTDQQRSFGQLTVYSSVGLPGSEVLLADRLLAAGDQSDLA